MVGFILLPLMSLQFLFEYAWNWFSVITGCNDELLFHVSAPFAMSFGTSFGMSTHAFSALALTAKFISKFVSSSKLWYTVL